MIHAIEYHIDSIENNDVNVYIPEKLTSPDKIEYTVNILGGVEVIHGPQTFFEMGIFIANETIEYEAIDDYKINIKFHGPLLHNRKSKYSINGISHSESENIFYIEY